MATSSEEPNAIISGSVIQGLLWGLLAGFGFSVLTLLNRGYVRNHSPLLLTCWQNGFAALVLLPWSLSESWMISGKEWSLLFILGVICTVGGHTLLINGLRHVKAQIASLLIAGLEPVGAILFALFLLGEIPSLKIQGMDFLLGEIPSLLLQGMDFILLEVPSFVCPPFDDGISPCE